MPVFITSRLLLLARVFRGIGLLQISFSNMFEDIFNWIGILFVILVGYSVSFSLLGPIMKHMSKDSYEICKETVFKGLRCRYFVFKLINFELREK